MSDGFRPDRIVIDLDPREGALTAVRRAAKLVREALDALRLTTVPVATGSKGYHLVAAIAPRLDAETIASTTQKLAALLAADHPEELTIAFRTALRGGRVFIDWMRNIPGATVVTPNSVRARPRASVAAPLHWEELDQHAPDAFTMDDVDRLRERSTRRSRDRGWSSRIPGPRRRLGDVPDAEVKDLRTQHLISA